MAAMAPTDAPMPAVPSGQAAPPASRRRYPRVERKAVLTFIRVYARQYRRAPTLREIAAGVGVASTNSVHRHLCALRADGWLDWTPGAARTLRVCSGRERQERLRAALLATLTAAQAVQAAEARRPSGP